MLRFARFAFLLPLVTTLSFAEQNPRPDLATILARLDANLRHYDAGVPSLFCDEHAVSSQALHNTQTESTVTESVFRLRRTSAGDGTTALVESREIKTANGKAPESATIDGPASLSGMFEGGKAVVSRSQAACMKYTLEGVDKKRQEHPYVIRFETALTPNNADGCFLQEKSKGLADVDPISMEVSHLEITTLHHVISDGSYDSKELTGRRELSVDYAPVQLGGETFWMPSAIDMTTGSGFGYMDHVWRFQAEYRNYRRMEVTTRILPAGGEPK